jgi:hypothetical protein
MSGIRYERSITDVKRVEKRWLLRKQQRLRYEDANGKIEKAKRNVFRIGPCPCMPEVIPGYIHAHHEDHP